MEESSNNTGQRPGGSYAQKAIPLTGGLDLTSPRMLVQPGRLVDVLNYECVDTDGYKKIDGFERYDGGASTSGIDAYNFTTNASNSNQAAWSLDTNLYVGTEGALFDDRNLSAPVVIPITITSITYVDLGGGAGYWQVGFTCEQASTVNTIIDSADNGDSVFVWDDPISPTMTTSIIAYDGGTGIAIYSASDLGVSNTNADALRAEVEALPQDQFAYGVQLYKDSLHVIADCQWVYIAFDDALYASQPPIDDREFFVGNTFAINTSGGMQGIIMDYKILRGGFFATNTTDANRTWIKVLVYPTTPGVLADDVKFYIDRVNSPYSSFDVSAWKIYTAIDVNGPTDDVPVWGAVLYKSLEEGSARTSSNDWTQLDMGYEVTFEDGDSVTEPRELTLATTQDELNNVLVTATGFPFSEAASFGNITNGFEDSSTTTSVTLDSGDYTLETDEGNPIQTGVYATRGGNSWGDGQGIFFSNFGFNLPEDAIIRGLVVEATCWYESADANMDQSYFHVVRFYPNDEPGSGNGPADQSANRGGTNPSDRIDSASSATPNTFTYGAPTDSWDFLFTPTIINDPAFRLEMSPSLGPDVYAAVSRLLWSKLTVTVHYFIPAGKAFFFDGTDEVEAKLVRVGLDEGSWASGDAKGTLHVYDLVPSVARNYIKVGDRLRLSSNGTEVATVTGVNGSFLPGHSTFVASDRRAQIVRSNFYLNPEWESLYGVTGMSRAWSYDSKYFRKIYTEYERALDMPSHICNYRSYLVLGYNSGNMLLSAVSGDKGPLPEEFRSLKGAREFVFIDNIHGLAELADTSLGVFCKSSIKRLVFNTGAATADALFYQAVISPNSGCVEYTVANFGDNTIYCDQYGIRTVESTDVYGDLVARPLSYPVSPWLRPRLSSKKYWVNSAPSKKPLFAHTIKAKNQYRVWFDDGVVLCMNLNSNESPAQFTFLKYGFGFGSRFIPLCPIAFSNDTDSTVTERLHLAHWNRKLASDAEENDPTKFKYLFELERGWTFDGEDFPARLTVNLSLLESPFNFDNVRKAELHGLDYNNTTLFCGWGTKYSEELSYSGLSMGDTFTPAGRSASGTVSTDYIPFSKVIQTAARGRPLLMKLKNSTTATGDEAASAIEPPHILQAVLLQYIPLRDEG